VPASQGANAQLQAHQAASRWQLSGQRNSAVAAQAASLQLPDPGRAVLGRLLAPGVRSLSVTEAMV
jgi:hypothetical protein